MCQLAWVLLEYTRTAMFHWMFLEVYNEHVRDDDGDDNVSGGDENDEDGDADEYDDGYCDSGHF